MRAVLVGERSVWERAGWRPGLAELRDTGLGLKPPRPGRPTPDGGRLSAASFEEALRLAARGLVAGVVTAPVSKENWAQAGYPWTDHTDRLVALAGKGGAHMVLGVPSRNLWCVLATRHVPLKEAPRLLSAREVVASARRLDEALRLLGRARPKLALCALNPHAGEGGLLGAEERRLLAPAVAAARAEGLSLSGPLPADSAWRLHAEGAYDGLVCLYHDQALIPLKALGGLSGVNWTLGLPFVRTSPAHGTAYDAAASGKSDASAFAEASLLAALLVS
ncbi:MAG: 4-hydroxythreonine-4-phosphate dehydrogenase PdxA [Elusimicrobiota bacterium]|nr:4-hydroxythreonine-4-phosphate dehydrogenase PdxA [Elusimicrobiota bacterium]